MAQRSRPKIRPLPPPKPPWVRRHPSQAMLDRDFPDLDRWGRHRKAVCTRCHWVMNDCEPMTSCGEFWHLAPKEKPKAYRCRNNGKRFSTEEHEIEPFMRKGRRSYLKRAGIRA